MRVLSSAREQELARQLLLREAAGHHDPAALAGAAERILQRLRADLSRWFGPDGFLALLDRALQHARSAYPALAVVHPAAHGVQSLEGLAESTRSLGPAETADMFVVFIAALFGLISRLVGDDLAAHLVMQGWPDASRPEQRRLAE